MVTLNADVPAMLSAPISHEFTLARDVFGLDDATLATIARAGVEASFMDAARQSRARPRDRRLARADEADWGGGGGIRTLEGLRQPQPA